MVKKAKRSTYRKMARTSGDHFFPVYRGPAYSMGMGVGQPTGRNYMKIGGVEGKIFWTKHVKPFAKNRALPFLKKHGLRASSDVLNSMSEGKKPLKSIKSALKNEFDIIAGKSRKNKSKKSIKGLAKKKRTSFKKRGKGKGGGFRKISL